jgi:hypothetical protein
VLSSLRAMTSYNWSLSLIHDDLNWCGDNSFINNVISQTDHATLCKCPNDNCYLTRSRGPPCVLVPTEQYMHSSISVDNKSRSVNIGPNHCTRECVIKHES